MSTEHIPVADAAPFVNEHGARNKILAFGAATTLVGGSILGITSCSPEPGSDEVKVSIPANEIEANCAAAADADIQGGVTAQESLDRLGPSLLAGGGSGPVPINEAYAKDPNDRDAIIAELAGSLPANPLAVSIIGQGIVTQNSPTVSPDFVEVAANRAGNNYLPENRDARIKECTGVIGALISNGEVGEYQSLAASSITYVYNDGVFKELKTTAVETQNTYTGITVRGEQNGNAEYIISLATGEYIAMEKDGGQNNDDSEDPSEASPTPSAEATNRAPADSDKDKSDKDKDKEDANDQAGQRPSTRRDEGSQSGKDTSSDGGSAETEDKAKTKKDKAKAKKDKDDGKAKDGGEGKDDSEGKKGNKDDGKDDSPKGGSQAPLPDGSVGIGDECANGCPGTGDSQTPAPGGGKTEAPEPKPSSQAPTPQPSTEAPTPQPSTEAPTPQPSTEAPTPQPSTPAPQPTTSSPSPEGTKTGTPTDPAID